MERKKWYCKTRTQHLVCVCVCVCGSRGLNTTLPDIFPQSYTLLYLTVLKHYTS